MRTSLPVSASRWAPWSATLAELRRQSRVAGSGCGVAAPWPGRGPRGRAPLCRPPGAVGRFALG
jgi:hypothetical protein